MNTVKDVIERGRAEMGHFEALLRKALPNQHIADILKDAIGRLYDAANHPDAETSLDVLRAIAEPAQTGEPNPMQG